MSEDAEFEQLKAKALELAKAGKRGKAMAALIGHRMREAEAEAEKILKSVVPDTDPLFMDESSLKNRTRFFVSYATKHGVRVSALLYLVAVHTRKKWLDGVKGQHGGWGNTAAWFADQLGVTRHRAYQLFQEAKKTGLFKYVRRRRGIVAWVAEEVHQAYGHDNQPGTGRIGHYKLDRAKEFGLKTSIVLSFFETLDQNEDYPARTAKGLAACFPWLSVASAGMILERLWLRNLLCRRDGIAGKAGHKIYFFDPKREVHKVTNHDHKVTNHDHISTNHNHISTTGKSLSTNLTHLSSVAGAPLDKSGGFAANHKQSCLLEVGCADVPDSASLTSSVKPEAASVSVVEPGKEVKPGKIVPLFSGSSAVGYKTQAQAAEQQEEENQVKRVSPVPMAKGMAAFLKMMEEFDRPEVEERMRKYGLL